MMVRGPFVFKRQVYDLAYIEFNKNLDYYLGSAARMRGTTGFRNTDADPVVILRHVYVRSDCIAPSLART